MTGIAKQDKVTDKRILYQTQPSYL